MYIPDNEPSVERDGPWTKWTYNRLHIHNCRLDGGAVASVDCAYDQDGRLSSVMGSVMYALMPGHTVSVTHPVVLYDGAADVQESECIRDARARTLDMAREWLRRTVQNAYLALGGLDRMREGESADGKPRHDLSVAEQPRDRLYRMCLRFVGDAGLKELDDLAAMCGLHERAVAQDAVTLRITQTVPFIPDDETIARYAKIVEQGQRESGIALSNVRFDGYDYIYPVAPGSDAGKESPDAVQGSDEAAP